MKPKHPSLGSQQKELLLFISIPLAVIILVGAVIVIPRMLANPKYDFVYSNCSVEYRCSSGFNIDENGIIQKEVQESSYANDSQTLYYYSEDAGSSKPINLSDAQMFRMDSSNISPDGYSLEFDDSKGGFFIWSDNSENEWYLVDGLKKKKVKLISNDYYSQRKINLVGWVL